MFQQLTREIDFLPKIMKIHYPVKKNSNYLHCNFTITFNVTVSITLQ